MQLILIFRLRHGFRIRRDYLHIKAPFCPPCNVAADAAHANNAHRFASQLYMIGALHRTDRLHLPLIELRHVERRNPSRQAQQKAHCGF